MEQNPVFQQHLNEAKILLDQGRDISFIESHLHKQDLDKILIQEVMKYINRLRNAKRTKTGSTLILIGVLLMGAGFISCMFLVGSGSSLDFALYGLTTCGAAVLIAGLAMIFH